MDLSPQLHSLDIKTVDEFVYDKTTHVASEKRNLPKVLQGLVSATPIVSRAFLDALVRVGSLNIDQSGEYVPSQLEEDFETWWPKEKEYIPPAGAEPVPRPEQALEPDASRSEVFSGLTFIFLNDKQCKGLQDPIGGGGGKVLFFNVQPGSTTVEEYVDYVMKAADRKKRSNTNSGRLPVITVHASKWQKGTEEWAADFMTRVDRTLDQRSILQNEFLDVIVTKDTSSLMQPPLDTLEVESSVPVPAAGEGSMHGPSPATASRAASQSQEPTPGPSQEPAKTIPRKRTFRRAGTTSRFTGFDDYEPPSKTRKIEEEPAPMEDIQESAPIETAGTTANQAKLLPVRESTEVTNRSEDAPPSASNTRRRVTRATSASVEPETRVSRQPKSKTAAILEQAQKVKKPTKEINVLEHTRQRVKEEDDRRKADEENLREALEGFDMSEMKNLFQVQEIDIKPREKAGHSTEHNDRWNDEWNGRKNFKKFRRRGTERGPRPNKVLVTLEQASQKKGFDTNDTFLTDEVEPTRTNEDERRLKRRMGPVEVDSSDNESGFARPKRTRTTESIVVEDSDGNGADASPAASSATRRNVSSGRTQRVLETQLGESQAPIQSSARKRGPATVAAGQPASKRSRAARREEDSDEEETGFRFRRRG